MEQSTRENDNICFLNRDKHIGGGEKNNKKKRTKKRRKNAPSEHYLNVNTNENYIGLILFVIFCV